MREGDSMKPIQLKQKDLRLLNQQLADLEKIQADIDKAINAGVPGCEECDAKCKEMRARIAKIKAAYFSNEI